MVALARVEEGGDQPQVVDTLGGRIHVRWDQDAAATPHGQLVFFAEFLAATGVFERWVSSCPLEYRSGNAPDKRDVLGTLMMGMLAGHRRYAHITALRGDAVAAQALGMNKVVSEDALRRALERIDEAASTAWMRPALMHSVREALDKPWVLDIDATIKPLYGRQEGAEIGYNPSKPKRPSHVLHTFWVGNLRLVLDVQVSSGKQHTSVHAKAALGRLLDELGDKRPALVRGDSGYGNEGMLLELEGRGQPYLLRLRQTANVQRLVARQFERSLMLQTVDQQWRDHLANLDHLRPRMPWIADEPLTVEARRDLVQGWDEAWAKGGDVVMGIFQDGVAVGSAGLHQRIGPTGLEIGYWVDAGHVGRGIARRASAALTSLAFTSPSIDHVEIHHDLTNVASRRVPERLGFHLVGRLAPPTRPLAPDDVGIDLVWRIARDEWPVVQPG